MTLSISSNSPAIPSAATGTAASSATSAADRATDAALAKATTKLATDKKAHATADVLGADQKAVTVATKAADKADAASKTDSSKVNLTI